MHNFISANRKAKDGKTIKYKIRFMKSVRFMASSLSSLTDNLAQGLRKGKREHCKFSLEYMTAEDSLLIFKCMDCNKTYEKEFDEDLLKIFKNTYRFCDRDLNKLFLILGKGFYPYMYMDGW